jgi:two-component system chemotaxis sensor kinase CheA
VKRPDLAARLLASFIGELDEQVRIMNAELLALEASPESGLERVHVLFRIAHTLKGAARAAGVPAIEQTCHQLEDRLAKARNGSLPLTRPDFERMFATADWLTEAARQLKASGQAPSALDVPPTSAPDGGAEASVVTGTVSPASPAQAARPADPDGTARPAAEELLRVQAGKLDHLLMAGTDLLVAGGRVALRASELEALNTSLGGVATRWRKEARRLQLLLQRLGAPNEMPELLELVGELERIADDASHLALQARSDARSLARSVDEVLDSARRIRLRPFEEACEALPRTVRDVAEASGKEVRFQLDGRDVEADRVVLDGLREPMLALVRNAVDHGIEAPLDRVVAGKERMGVVRVGAELRGDRLLVSVSDDGAGLDVEGIRAELGRRGLAVPDNPRELGQALFDTRLSTRAEATEVSGRGVGLDIVRVACARMGGRVDVTWNAGKGTTFSLDLPLSLATMRTLMVSVASHMVAIPVDAVERASRIATTELSQTDGRAMLSTPEGTVPVIPLGALLSPMGERSVASPTISLVLLREGSRRLAVVVDELHEVRDLAVRPLSGMSVELRAVRGAALLETGTVALVVEPGELLAAGLAQQPGPTLVVAETGPQPRRRRVLVVDDSITTRTMERTILEDAGYEVYTAVDGSDGWRLLQEEETDLVVADVEMPRMDGFALVETIRASNRFADLPVVLVTGLEKPEDRARGLAAGADAYIGKSSFDARDLLQTVEQLLSESEVAS